MLTIDFTYNGVPRREKTAHMIVGDCLVYILESYKTSNAAEAEKTWNRMIGSLHFAR